MARKLKIYTLEYNIRHTDVTNLHCFSQGALIDADVVILDPDGISNKVLKINHEHDLYDGLPILSESYSHEVLKMLKQRLTELTILLDNGRTIFCFLKPEYKVNVIESVNSQFKGSRTIRMRNLSSISNYSLLPNYLRFSAGTGVKIEIKKSIFDSVICSINEKMHYDAYVIEEAKQCIIFAVTPSTKNPVGVVMPLRKGNIVFLPTIARDGEDKDSKLFSFFVNFTKTLIEKSGVTPPPDWSQKFLIPTESSKKVEISAIEKEIEQNKQKLNDALLKLFEIQKWKQLLYEQGKPLESIVKESFFLLGFIVSDFKNNSQEHDIIIEGVEGRALGEIEGKDDSPVNVDKFRQLSANLDEDFERNGKYAKGLLIGNGYRFIDPSTPRPSQFTEKVISGSKSKEFALLTTEELFAAVIYCLGNNEDEGFKKSCRDKIFNTSGDLVKFDMPSRIPGTGEP